MNYRHGFHAGSFADVLKHAILALVIEHLKQKPSPFRVIDTHAGSGRYDLGGDAARTGEWLGGIGRLIDGDIPPAPAALLAPYLEVVRAINDSEHGGLAAYPGSPTLARRLLRPSDRLLANELNEDERVLLARLFSGDPQVKVLGLDGWTALRSLLPPKERRGVVLIDPPFEKAGEFQRLIEGLRDAVRRFETGIYLLWYPVKDPKRASAFLARLSELGLPRVGLAELLVRKPVNPDLLNGCGMVIINPPHLLDEKLAVLLPYLARRLALGPGAEARFVPIGAATLKSSRS